MDPLFVLFHSLPETDRVKVIGIYTSRPLAEAALDRARGLPGFCDEPEGFTIDATGERPAIGRAYALGSFRRSMRSLSSSLSS